MDGGFGRVILVWIVLEDDIFVKMTEEELFVGCEFRFRSFCEFNIWLHASPASFVFKKLVEM